MFTHFLKSLPLSFLLIVTIHSCEKEQTIITPAGGYAWPSQERVYWPTDGWQTATLESHGMGPGNMELPIQSAKNDELARALLVVKDGYLVHESYYGDGGIDQSTNLWSVTKSISSALIGILFDQDVLNSSDQLMAELMPEYPEFNAITLHHVLTQTTGLSWAESGPLWVDWILSEDWVTSALERGMNNDPGGFSNTVLEILIF